MATPALTRSGSRSISTRVTHAQYERVEFLARTMGIAIATLLRRDVLDACDALEKKDAPRARLILKTGVSRKLRPTSQGGTPTVYLDGVIGVKPGELSAVAFREQLAALGDVAEFNVEINCDGGDIVEGMAMYSALRAHAARKVGVVTGIAASMGSVVLMACDERRVAKGAFVMIHRATGGARGTPEQMRGQANVVEKMQAELLDIYVERSKVPRAELEAMLAVETYLTAEEAVARGFAEKVETFEAQITVEAVARLERGGAGRLPAVLRAASETEDPNVALATITDALRLPADAKKLQVLDAIDALYKAVAAWTPPAPDGAGTAGVPDTAPAAIREAVARLSPEVLAQIKARNQTPEEFIRQRNATVRNHSR